MKYSVSYSLITWSMSPKIKRLTKVVEAENPCDAVKKVLVKTSGKAYNFIVNKLEE